jgi:hypothetical protein
MCYQIGQNFEIWASFFGDGEFISEQVVQNDDILS